MKNIFIIGAIVVFLLFGASWWTKSLQSSDPNIISTKGIHWHPELAIYVKGVKQEIPAGLGLGAIEMPIHTHDSTGVIHLEFGGLVNKSDITLDRFFKIWGKDIRSFGTDLKMTVNGKESIEFDNYIMQDKDKIELRFE